VTPAAVNEIVFLDFEFIAECGEKQKPICMVATEQRTGRTFRLWLEKDVPGAPPFRTGPEVLTVAYFASAEWGCYLALGWPLPRLTLDLYAEFRVATNGLTLPHGRGLLGAMQWFGLNGIEAAKKDHLRNRILARGPYSAEERQAILDYCQSDVDGLAQLYPRLIREDTNLIPALWRGEYMKVIAIAEYSGVPLDAALYQRMTEHWSALQSKVIARVNETIPVFEDGHLREALVEKWLRDQHLLANWRRTPTGGLRSAMLPGRE
jgi:hypothetical protein